MSKKVKIGLLFTILLVLLAVVILYNIYESQQEYQNLSAELPVHYNGEQFAGSTSCIPCHESIYQTHLSTAHYNTSNLANGESLLGSFNGPEDKINFLTGSVEMTEEDGQYFQITKQGGKQLSKSQIDITFGSGVKGQSHLSFEENSLFQLQASYFTLTDSWINSPGFPNTIFNRPVMDNCIKCHVTFAKNDSISGLSNSYDKTSFILGIDCERCHGPLQKHVDAQSGIGPGHKNSGVVKYDTLDRQRKLDLCAQCHAGLRARQIKGNPFSYVIGEKLDDFSRNYNAARPTAKLDVHGNQYGLLTSSACFKNSEEMSCTTCHDPHLKQRGESQYFNNKCMECHSEPIDQHAMVANTDKVDFTNCIECHMPLFPSNTMQFEMPDTKEDKSVEIRTHLIGVYVDKVLRRSR